MPEPRPRVLVADDHPIMLAGLRKILEPGFEVVGTATDGRSLLAAAETLRPDLVLADISMPELNGIEATRRLRELVPQARVLILSLHTDPCYVQAAFAAGAYGYLPKTAAGEEIKLALLEVLQGRFYVSPVVAQAALVAPPASPTARSEEVGKTAGETLTARELSIVRLVGKGLGNKAIAQELGVSVATIRTHLNRVYEKLSPGSRVELALYAAHGRETVM